MRYWLTSDDGKVTGPHTLDALVRLQRDGLAGPRSMACAEGNRDWVPLNEVLLNAPRTTSVSASQPISLDTSVTLLRVLLLLTIAFAALGVLASVADSALGYGITEMADEETLSVGDLLGCGVSILLLGFAVVVVIGLFRYWPWARWASVVLAVIGAGIEVFFPFFSSEGPFSQAVSPLSNLTTGALVVALFFTPVAQKFTRPLHTP